MGKIVTETGKYLERQKIEYQYKNGVDDMSDTEWARYLGATPQLYNGWTNQGKRPTGEYLRRIAIKLGFRIYELADKEVPSDLSPFSSLPPALLEAVLATNKRIASLGTPVDFSTSLKILAEETKPFEVMATSNTDKDGSTK